MSWFPLVLLCVGVGAVVFGVALLSVPVAWIVAGVSVVLVALLVDFDRTGGAPRG